MADEVFPANPGCLDIAISRQALELSSPDGGLPGYRSEVGNEKKGPFTALNMDPHTRSNAMARPLHFLAGQEKSIPQRTGAERRPGP